MRKKFTIVLVIILFIALGIACYLAIDKIYGKKNTDNSVTNIGKSNEVVNVTDDEEDDEEKDKTTNIEVVPTMQDKISADSAWCATFQLVWNDLKDELVGQDIVFNPQIEMVKNLNKEEFNKDMISDEYYYINWGLKTLKLKEEIEKGIKEKFNQTSDILDKFDWSEEGLNDEDNPDLSKYFFYTMLYREFEFPKVFDVLDNGKFGKKYNDVEYFGIDDSSEKILDEQIDVLYYDSEDDFAVVLNTKSGDEVIVSKGADGKSFGEIYDNVATKSEEYEGSKHFEGIDKFKMPKLDFNVLREYKELENKEFSAADGDAVKIAKALQSIKFTIDEKGGKIKSEAAVSVEKSSMAIGQERPEPRLFYVDDTFTIFLKEEDRDVPYFAARVDDITKYQDSNK